MKKSILVLLAFLSVSYSGSAQEIKRCSSAEYLSELERNDPGVYQRRMEKEADRQQWIAVHGDAPRGSVVTIPVVFHLLYNDSTQYLDDAVILSQLDAINEDYRRTNSDTGQTPLAFRAVAADCEIAFCLAQRTPGGLPTNGMIRKYTTVTSFSDYDECKFSVLGGDDAWDPSRYLNIWVAAFTNSNFLGLGTFPNSVPAAYDGVVINYKACGRIGTHLMQHYNKGRSLTHEIGHWLNLLHIWGDDGSACTSDDFVSDTPLEAGETYGCPSYPKTDNCTSSFPGVMFMNFMDYTDDACMNIFTEGQKVRMLAALNVDRASILSSDGCLPVGIEENDLRKYFSVFPNPASDRIRISCHSPGLSTAVISVVNLFGETVLPEQDALLSSTATMDVSTLASGIYFLRVNTEQGEAVFKIIRQ